ncbi:hypothetical protein AMEX_G23663 [Astyanax mexicanus]|uniref:Uncharacterized protein n=1 Tax=Astyanax mexicanus TaxID=7994 RepID=A0A8T2KXM3_ASTMX|nr:hypothetical protein AMEX_G23663 [Astyanax mexicanus]
MKYVVYTFIFYFILGSECFIVETVTDCDAVTDESVLYHPFQTFHPEPSNYGLTIHKNSYSPSASDNLQFDDVNSVTSQQSNDYRPTTPNLQQKEECELDDLYDFRYLKRAVEISLRRLERAAASRSREDYRSAIPLFTERVLLLVRHCVDDIDNNVTETPRL